ncbi:MAG: transposase [Planctomycetota bacterium]|jgi:hypothetical protein
MTFELTARCTQARFLLRPSDERNARFLGVMGRALELYGAHVRLHFAGGTSNHIHLLVSTEDARWKAMFKSFLFGNVSKEIGELYDWPGPFWHRRCRDIPVLDDGSVYSRAMYLAAQAAKDGLTTVGSWPGIQWVKAVTEGRPLRGVWYDRATLYEQRMAWARADPAKRGRRPALQDVARTIPVELTPLPMWAELSESERRARWSELVERAIEAFPPKSETMLGAEAVLAFDPHHRPARASRQPAPESHASSPEKRAWWRAQYALLVHAYRALMRQIRDGLRGADAAEPFAWCAGLPWPRACDHDDPPRAAAPS